MIGSSQSFTMTLTCFEDGTIHVELRDFSDDMTDHSQYFSVDGARLLPVLLEQEFGPGHTPDQLTDLGGHLGFDPGVWQDVVVTLLAVRSSGSAEWIRALAEDTEPMSQSEAEAGYGRGELTVDDIVAGLRDGTIALDPPEPPVDVDSPTWWNDVENRVDPLPAFYAVSWKEPDRYEEVRSAVYAARGAEALPLPERAIDVEPGRTDVGRHAEEPAEVIEIGPGADLRGARLQHRDLRGADLTGADLREAKLFCTKLCGAVLRDADLRGAELGDADLRGADLRGATVTDAQSWFGTQLAHANLAGLDLRGATLRLAALERADLTGADLRGVELNGAVLTGAVLRGADLTGAVLPGADLRWADLRGATLCGAQLHNCDLSGADLTGADLTGAGYGATLTFSNTRMPDGSLRSGTS
ncbi:MAG: pentapeptide repeat-containing protein [Microthrixaceae bacterium]